MEITNQWFHITMKVCSMIDVTKVDWQAFKKDLQSIKKTVPRWATEKNIKSIEMRNY